MQRLKQAGRVVAAGLFVMAAQSHAVGTLYISSDGSASGVQQRDSETLAQENSFAVNAPITGIVRGQSNDLYLTAGNTLFNYGVDGTLINSANVVSGPFRDVTLFANQIIAAVGTGITIRDPQTLAQSTFFATAAAPTSVEDGFGRLYITAGNQLFIYNANGEELASFTDQDSNVEFVESAVSGTRLYVGTTGTTNRISVRSPITLAEITSFAVPFAVDGLVAGDFDDLFITSGDSVFQYATDGTELNAISAEDASLMLTDVTFVADPRPPAEGTVLALTTGNQDAVVKRDGETLADAGSFPLSAAGTGIALSNLNAAVDAYIASGATLFRYDTDGNLLGSVTGGGGVTFSDVAITGTELAASITGSSSGVSLRTLDTLAENSSFATAFEPTSVSAGSSGEIYLTAGSDVYRYSTSGSELASFGASDGRVFTDTALVANVVYATYTNASGEDGISVLDPATLVQVDVIATPIAANGITAGGTNDYYISGNDTIVHFALDEVLNSFSAGTGNVFPDVVYSVADATTATSVIAATLPGSRSVQVGATASAFATVLNTGSVTANGCRISPRTGVPATFSYQTTDSATNELTGAPNTPADIAAGGFQTFLFSFVPTAAIPSTDVALDFQCGNASAAPVTPGVNTLLLSADTDPVADVVALASTISNNGIVEVSGGAGAFAVASVNVGSQTAIDVEASVTDGDPNITLSLCETNPATGACVNPTAPTTGPVSLTIDANATPTFSVFVSASGDVALDPANKRIVVQFTEQSNGAVRGATSVAVQTVN